MAREQIVVYLQKLHHWRIEVLARLDGMQGDQQQRDERWIERLEQSIALFEEQIAEIDGKPRQIDGGEQKAPGSVDP